MAVRRIDRRRKKPKRVPDAGAGRRRSQMAARKRSSFVDHDYGKLEQTTPFGKRATLVQGPYEVFLEVMGPKVATGIVTSEEGTLTLFCRLGTLFVQLIEENGETRRSLREQLRPGDHVTFRPGQQYGLSTGDSPADIMRIQTAGYETVQVTAPMMPSDMQNLHVAAVQSTEARREEVSQDYPKRRSYDKAYRQRIASQIEQDRAHIRRKKAVTRKVRESAPTLTGPRPLGEQGAAAVAQADMAASDAAWTAGTPPIIPRGSGGAQ